MPHAVRIDTTECMARRAFDSCIMPAHQGLQHYLDWRDQSALPAGTATTWLTQALTVGSVKGLLTQVCFCGHVEGSSQTCKCQMRCRTQLSAWQVSSCDCRLSTCDCRTMPAHPGLLPRACRRRCASWCHAPHAAAAPAGRQAAAAAAVTSRTRGKRHEQLELL
jgi:hypothetical protein